MGQLLLTKNQSQSRVNVTTNSDNSPGSGQIPSARLGHIGVTMNKPAGSH